MEKWVPLTPLANKPGAKVRCIFQDANGPHPRFHKTGTIVADPNTRHPIVVAVEWDDGYPTYRYWTHLTFFEVLEEEESAPTSEYTFSTIEYSFHVAKQRNSVVKSEYNTTCSKCGSPAYAGLFVIECSKGCNHG